MDAQTTLFELFTHTQEHKKDDEVIIIIIIIIIIIFYLLITMRHFLSYLHTHKNIKKMMRLYI